MVAQHLPLKLPTRTKSPKDLPSFCWLKLTARFELLIWICCRYFFVQHPITPQIGRAQGFSLGPDGGVAFTTEAPYPENPRKICPLFVG
jgi:hypothetical protein